MTEDEANNIVAHARMLGIHSLTGFFYEETGWEVYIEHWGWFHEPEDAWDAAREEEFKRDQKRG